MHWIINIFVCVEATGVDQVNDCILGEILLLIKFCISTKFYVYIVHYLWKSCNLTRELLTLSNLSRRESWDRGTGVTLSARVWVGITDDRMHSSEFSREIKLIVNTV